MSGQVGQVSPFFRFDLNANGGCLRRQLKRLEEDAAQARVLVAAQGHVLPDARTDQPGCPVPAEVVLCLTYPDADRVAGRPFGVKPRALADRRHHGIEAHGQRIRNAAMQVLAGVKLGSNEHIGVATDLNTVQVDGGEGVQPVETQ